MASFTSVQERTQYVLIIACVNRKRLGSEMQIYLLTNKYMRQTAAIGLIIGLVSGFWFFLHRLNPGRVAVQKIDNPLPAGAKKNLKNLPGSLNSARV